MKRDQYRKEHEMDFNIHYAAKRTLERLLKDNPDKTLHLSQWRRMTQKQIAKLLKRTKNPRQKRSAPSVTESSYPLFLITGKINQWSNF